MLIQEARAAMPVTRKGEMFYTIKVWKHKTTSTFGSASLVTSPTLYNQLIRYLDLIRKDCGPEDYVFVSSTGNKISKASDELKRLADSFGKDLDVTPTLNRKILSTNASSNLDDEQVRTVATHMTHDLGTATKYYHVQADKERAVEAYQLLNHPGEVSPYVKVHAIF